MLPTLRPGRLVAMVRSHRPYMPGDVIIFEHQGLEKIKRVSGTRAGKLFVRGDNPGASTDSRHFGWLEMETVKGKVIWPKSRQIKNS